MKTYTVGDFKTNFSDALAYIRQGRAITLSFGKKKEPVAVLVPYQEYKKANRIKLGILENKASFKVGADFKMTDEQLLSA